MSGSPADLYVIGCLWWGDYTGDDVARSNHRSLRRDFPDEFIGLFDAIGTAGLALPPGCRNDKLVTALLGLRDYPLYDDDDNSALIIELADEAWDGWLRLDVPAMLRDEHGIDTDDTAERSASTTTRCARCSTASTASASATSTPKTPSGSTSRPCPPPSPRWPPSYAPAGPPESPPHRRLRAARAAATSWCPSRTGRGAACGVSPGGRWPIPVEDTIHDNRNTHADHTGRSPARR